MIIMLSMSMILTKLNGCIHKWCYWYHKPSQMMTVLRIRSTICDWDHPGPPNLCWRSLCVGLCTSSLVVHHHVSGSKSKYSACCWISNMFTDGSHQSTVQFSVVFNSIPLPTWSLSTKTNHHSPSVVNSINHHHRPWTILNHRQTIVNHELTIISHD